MKQKITSFFFFIFSIGAFCQTEGILINESFEDMLMPEVFDILKEKYQLKLAYDYESIKNIKVNQKIKSKDLESTLVSLFSNTDLAYQLVENNRILIRKTQNFTNLNNSENLQKYILKGKIIDSKSQNPLAYATIFCSATNQGCSTDEAGNFSLTINSIKPEGTISIQYLGYIAKVLPWKKGKNLSNLQIKLQPKVLEFKEVTILEKVPILSLNQKDGAMVLRASQLSTLPSFVGGNDIFRSIQLLPGISATDDLSAELKIRGSNGDENMIILDGITLYKVDHYFGIFSAINSNIINQVKVYKNAFPVEYGGRTAGVIDLSTHSQIKNSKVSGGLQFDLLTSNAYLQVPINNKMGLFIGGRITNKNVANTDLFNLLQKNNETPNALNGNSSFQENPSFRFYDINAKWLWNISKKSSIAANFFRGYDNFQYNYELKFTNRNRTGEFQINNTAIFDEAADWNNQGASFQLNHQWTKKIKSNINLAYSSYNDSQLITTALVRKPERQPPRGHPEKIDTTFNLNNNAYNSIKGIELNIKNQWDISKQQKLTFGYHLVDNQVEFLLDVDNQRQLNNSKQGTQHSAYLQYDLKTKNKFNIALGLRNTYYTVTNKNYLSPRVNLSYQASDDLKLKATWSRYNQFLRKNSREDRFGRTYDFWVLANDKPRSFPISSSKQWMAGFNFSKSGFELDVEAYYKNIDGVTEYALQTIGFNPDGVTPPSPNNGFAIFNGVGISKGIDVLLKKNAGNYTGWIAYTLSKTTHSFPQINRGKAFPSQDDRRHQLKWVNQYRYKQFDFSATYIYSSGKPYTDVSNFSTDSRDRGELTAEERISYLADYNRMDVSASYRFNWGTSKARIGLSIFNVLNRKNVKYRQYFYSIPERTNSNIPARNTVLGTELQLLDFTPNISFSLDF